jgi:hypothetical protein
LESRAIPEHEVYIFHFSIRSVKLHIIRRKHTGKGASIGIGDLIVELLASVSNFRYLVVPGEVSPWGEPCSLLLAYIKDSCNKIGC